MPGGSGKASSLPILAKKKRLKKESSCYLALWIPLSTAMWSSPGFPSLEGAPEGQVAPREKEEKDVYVSKTEEKSTAQWQSSATSLLILQWNPPEVDIWASRGRQELQEPEEDPGSPAPAGTQQPGVPPTSSAAPGSAAATQHRLQEAQKPTTAPPGALSAGLAGGQGPQHLSVWSPALGCPSSPIPVGLWGSRAGPAELGFGTAWELGWLLGHACRTRKQHPLCIPVGGSQALSPSK